MAVKTRQDQRATIYFVTFSGTPPACHRWLPLFEETKLYDNRHYFTIFYKNNTILYFKPFSKIIERCRRLDS